MEKPPVVHETTPPPNPAWEAARQAGLDMDLLEDCLSRSPAERLRIHAVALQTADQLRRAMKERQNGSDDDPELPDRA